MNKIIKLAIYNDLGDCKRQDINDLISSLVRIGYTVYLNEDYVCFQFGNDDTIEERIEDEDRKCKF